VGSESGSQYTPVSSDEGELAGRSSHLIDIKGRREENANHIDNIRKRIYSGNYEDYLKSQK
jgi:hypothetical protein